MEGRQQGAIMSEMAESIDAMDVFDGSPNAKAKIAELVPMAFDVHRYNYPDLQRKAVVDFENDAFARCMSK